MCACDYVCVRLCGSVCVCECVQGPGPMKSDKKKSKTEAGVSKEPGQDVEQQNRRRFQAVHHFVRRSLDVPQKKSEKDSVLVQD